MVLKLVLFYDIIETIKAIDIFYENEVYDLRQTIEMTKCLKISDGKQKDLDDRLEEVIEERKNDPNFDEEKARKIHNERKFDRERNAQRVYRFDSSDIYTNYDKTMEAEATIKEEIKAEEEARKAAEQKKKKSSNNLGVLDGDGSGKGQRSRKKKGPE